MGEATQQSTDGRVYATGKRKSAIARVWIQAGTGRVTVNKATIDDYFDRESSRMVLRQPLDLTGTTDHLDVVATVHGGGKSAQADAVKHGISRALSLMNKEHRPLLKRLGFLTRDARVKERKKYGQRGARARYQFSKR
jgi:small subunit ribosomal protein S9